MLYRNSAFGGFHLFSSTIKASLAVEYLYYGESGHNDAAKDGRQACEGR